MRVMRNYERKIVKTMRSERAEAVRVPVESEGPFWNSNGDLEGAISTLLSYLLSHALVHTSEYLLTPT